MEKERPRSASANTIDKPVDRPIDTAIASGAALDLQHLDRQTLGDRSLQRELLQLFATQSPHLLQRMRQLPPSEIRHFDDLAHQLKGSARAIGAIRVAAMAEHIESLSANEAARAAALIQLADTLAEALAAIETCSAA